MRPMRSIAGEDEIRLSDDPHWAHWATIDSPFHETWHTRMMYVDLPRQAIEDRLVVPVAIGRPHGHNKEREAAEPTVHELICPLPNRPAAEGVGRSKRAAEQAAAAAMLAREGVRMDAANG